MTAPANNLPEIMKAVEIKEPGGPEVLQLGERPLPSPSGNEVLIKVHSAGVNRPDVLQRMGLYPPPPGASDIPGLEVAGVIASLGSEVSCWKVGDKVCALLTGGGYAEYAIADAGSCLPAPSPLSLEEAASIPETAFTVWANVFDDAGLSPEETLLVHGGTSGIGVMAIGMAKTIGARVIATAGSNEKCVALKRLGADIAYHYEQDAWEAEIAQNGGADVVLDMAGGDFVPRNLACLNDHGRHVSIAFLRGAEARFNVFDVMRKRLRLSGSTMKARNFSEKKRLAIGLKETFWPHYESRALTPVLDRIFPLSEAADAHKHMESGSHIGKIVLKTD